MDRTESLADSAARLSRVPAAPKHIHLIGVGGTAMAALAGMLKERGFAVSGSDNELYEPTASLLRRLEVNAKRGFAAANLDPAPDLVVVGNVVTRDNPEARRACAEPNSICVDARGAVALFPERSMPADGLRHARQDHLDLDDGAGTD